MFLFELGGVNDLVQPEASLEPGQQGKDFVGRSHLEPTGATVGAVSVEVHRGRSDAAAVFGVVEDLVLRHGQDPTRVDLHTD